ncbi:MAG: response regulator [Chitinophagales bacterium]
MKISCLIVDDDAGSRQTLRIFIEKYCDELEIIAEAEDVSVALPLIREKHPDLVFLDISMPGVNGFELLGLAKPVTFEVVFVTAYDTYTLKAIKNNAADYLMKPVSISELRDAVERVTRRIEARRATGNKDVVSVGERLSVPIRDGYMTINIGELIRCEADEGYTWLFIQNREKMLVSRTLKDFEDRLSHIGFIRVHRQHLINVKHVSRYINGRGGQVTMNDGATIDVSQRKRGDLLQGIGIME